MSNDKSYRGSCFCGAVELRVSGEPAAMGYCHCASCRSWSAGPVNAFSLWKPDAVRVTKGAGGIGTYHKTDKRSTRRGVLPTFTRPPFLILHSSRVFTCTTRRRCCECAMDCRR